MAITEGPRGITEVFVDNAQKWAEEGWGGYAGVNKGSANGATFMGSNTHLSVEEATLSIKPVIDYFKSVATATNTYRVRVVSLANQWELQNAPELQGFVDAGVGSMVAQASRLIPEDNFASDASKKELVDILAQRSYGALIVPPYKFELPESDQPGNPGASSLTPAWRTALWHVVYQEFWNPADQAANEPSLVAARYRNVTRDMDKLRAITPNGGAYMNEGDTYEPDPINSYWGQENYNRLLSIKKELDPDNMLSCFKCVGWEKSDARFQCYPEL